MTAKKKILSNLKKGDITVLDNSSNVNFKPKNKLLVNIKKCDIKKKNNLIVKYLINQIKKKSNE